ARRASVRRPTAPSARTPANGAGIIAMGAPGGCLTFRDASVCAVVALDREPRGSQAVDAASQQRGHRRVDSVHPRFLSRIDAAWPLAARIGRYKSAQRAW
ncbi:hypothetical protein BZM27_52500, partial [Paraburkholderia steynii]